MKTPQLNSISQTNVAFCCQNDLASRERAIRATLYKYNGTEISFYTQVMQKGAEMKRVVSLKVNGREIEDVIPDNMLLVDFLRDRRGLTGAKQGCDGGECGACTVLVNGRPRLSCITLAVSCAGGEIETIEAQAKGGNLSALQKAFHESLGAQCGFCTPGMIMAAESLLRDNPDPNEDEIRTALGGNLCRCTGYVKIIKSVQTAAAEMRA